MPKTILVGDENWQVVKPLEPQKTSTSAKKARERLDLMAQETRIGWKRLLEIADELFGKKHGFTLAECRQLMEELKRRRR